MLLKTVQVLLTFVVMSLIQVKRAVGIRVDDELTLTTREKMALDKFKEIVSGELSQDYMREEIYLIKWLRRAEFDVLKAKSLIEEHLKWRRENKMDTILDEDFEDFNEDYPIDTESEDREGRPVITSFVGDWDIRKSVLTGTRQQGLRHSFRAVELQFKKIRDKQAKGERVTQMQIIFDLKGFNIQQHACLRCLAGYIQFVRTFQKQYPGMADNIIFINTPSSIEAVFGILRPIASKDLKDALKIFGSDKEGWKGFLLSLIAPDQLPRSLGGTKV